MKFYIVTVNGEIATVAHLDDADGEALKAHVVHQRDDHPELAFRVIEQSLATTRLVQAEAEIESEVESWLP